MNLQNEQLLAKSKHSHLIDSIGTLTKEQLTELISSYTQEDFLYARQKASDSARKTFDSKVYIRALIEFSNYCRNNCLYCGIRRDNRNVKRYRLSSEQIIECCRKARSLGIKTFVLQSGEDLFYTDSIMCSLIKDIKKEFPDCAVTLSTGEKSLETYKAYKNAGADRFLLRHETADKCHYEKLHPQEMSFENRIDCLKNLISCGFQTGSGFMTGSPFQTPQNIAEDILFLKQLNPQMIGIGPFLPQHDTPFADCSAGSAELTLFLISLLRLLFPDALIPATTALSTAQKDGFVQGILCGANVIMLNVTPQDIRNQYSLYDNKNSLSYDDTSYLNELSYKLNQYGYEFSFEKGDFVKHYE